MKRFAALATLAVALPASAFADVTVNTPKNPVSAEEASAYVASLDDAVKKECRKVTGPVIGLAYYSYLACLKATRADVAIKDPTGLYAKRESAPATVLAAK
jgi:hypothetical protein